MLKSRHFCINTSHKRKQHWRIRMKLIIQIPCYNEANTLETALNALPRHIEGIDLIEYLIINDGSQDNTIEVAERWGINYIVNFKQNRGLAKGFMAGLDACLRNGADIIVNTDADNQYCGQDIEKLIQPILDQKADIVIGERPIDQTAHFSPLKKKLQHLGSLVVRIASHSEIPDAPSGFRAYSREAAMRLNVINEYTYTLETIVQAGQSRIAMTSVPIRTNDELRPSRLFNSMFGYVKKSMLTIVRAFLMYKPLRFFTLLGGGIFYPGICTWTSISGFPDSGKWRWTYTVINLFQSADSAWFSNSHHRLIGRYNSSKSKNYGRHSISRQEIGL